MAEDILTQRKGTSRAGRPPRCETCVHGFVHVRYPVAQVGVRCDWLGGQLHFKPDHYCAKWEPKEASRG